MLRGSEPTFQHEENRHAQRFFRTARTTGDRRGDAAGGGIGCTHELAASAAARRLYPLSATGLAWGLGLGRFRFWGRRAFGRLGFGRLETGFSATCGAVGSGRTCRWRAELVWRRFRVLRGFCHDLGRSLFGAVASCASSQTFSGRASGVAAFAQKSSCVPRGPRLTGSEATVLSSRVTATGPLRVRERRTCGRVGAVPRPGSHLLSEGGRRAGSGTGLCSAQARLAGAGSVFRLLGLRSVQASARLAAACACAGLRCSDHSSYCAAEMTTLPAFSTVRVRE